MLSAPDHIIVSLGFQIVDDKVVIILPVNSRLHLKINIISGLYAPSISVDDRPKRAIYAIVMAKLGFNVHACQPRHGMDVGQTQALLSMIFG